MSLKKLLLLAISLVFSAAGCAGIGPNATYYMGTTSFNYDPTYSDYMLKLNGQEIGGGFGGAMSTNSIKTGPQVITWEESNSDKLHRAKNQVTLTKEDLKGMKYLAIHLYPDDTVEVTTSNNWPNSTEKGLRRQERIRKNGAE